MISLIKHTVNVVKAVVREHSKRLTRSSKWSGVRKAALINQPCCAACGSTSLLQVHHMQPFHLHPELELDQRNLIVLCMGKNECHLLLGHGDNFKKYNPYIAADARNLSSGSVSPAEAIKLAKKNALLLPTNIS
jgi:5-methylcytosine-specific restriction endonuclease McrA